MEQWTVIETIKLALKNPRLGGRTPETTLPDPTNDIYCMSILFASTDFEP